MGSKKDLFKNKKYWYHVSTTLKTKKQTLIPWNELQSSNRSMCEPSGCRICVAPTIEQCITAIPYCLNILRIYRTEEKVIPKKATGVFDSEITNEGWLTTPTTFIKIGTLDLSTLSKKLKQEDIISESASIDDLEYCKEVLKWWKKAKIKRFIKKIL
jgi:hypothetical protein